MNRYSEEWARMEELQRQVRFWIWRRAKPPFTRYEYEELKK